MPASELKMLIEKTRFAISTEETRYYLNGIYLHEVTAGATPLIRAVATDGHRLAQVQFPRPPEAKGMPGVMCRAKTVLELSKLIEDAPGPIEIALYPSKFVSTIAGLILTSKWIDGTFPIMSGHSRGNDKSLQVETRTLTQLSIGFPLYRARRAGGETQCPPPRRWY